jgi:hypothetical protein
MSKARLGCTALGCAGVLALAVAALIFLPVIGPRLVEQLDLPMAEEEAPPPPALRGLKTASVGDRLLLTYGFADYEGRSKQISCTIGRRDYEREVASFGYGEQEIWDRLNGQVRERVLREVSARGLAPYFDLEVYEQTSYRWRWRLPGGLPPQEEKRATREMAQLDVWLNGKLRHEIDEMTDEVLQERGFRLRGNDIEIDYEQVATRGTQPLADCFEALQRAGRGEDEERMLGLFLAFFQELRYEVPPEEESGRRIHGFWVPTAVLARGGGDCDSKSVAFCSLWRNFPRRAILILVPGHALVGVEEKPGPGEAYVRLGNRYFVLCEVAGPGKIPPGRGAISGSYEYVMIEPVAGVSRPAAAPRTAPHPRAGSPP